MRRDRVTPIVLLLLACAAPASAQWSGGGNAELGAELRLLYQRFLDGTRARDTLAYRDLLTPGYVHVSGDTATVRAGRSARMRWDVRQPDSLHVLEARRCDVERYGDAAVGPCWFRQVEVRGGREVEFLGVSLVAFVRGADGRWRIAATRPSLARDVPR